MPDLALRGLSDHLHSELVSAANRNHRSLNGEIIAWLTASVRSEAVDVKQLLERIRLRHETLGPVDLREVTIREMRDSTVPRDRRAAAAGTTPVDAALS